MRKLTKQEIEEIQAIYDEVKDKVDNLGSQVWDAMINGNFSNAFTSSKPQPSATISAQDYAKLVQARQHYYLGTSHQFRNRPSQSYTGISPTDNQARGLYEYQEPEVDEQGTYYGYKVLSVTKDRYGDTYFNSPRYSVSWSRYGELESDREPSERSMHGIHCTKRPDHSELEQYYRPFAGAIYPEPTSVLVKCALSGTIVETEQGFRAQHAQIIGVYRDGYWRSYQDYQECSHADSRRASEAWESEQRDWKYSIYYGTGFNPNTYFDPSSGS